MGISSIHVYRGRRMMTRRSWQEMKIKPMGIVFGERGGESRVAKETCTSAGTNF